MSPLGEFPLLGAEMGTRWRGLRFILGPWRWMLIIHDHIPDDDLVIFVTVQDARSSSAPAR